jgi:hypothetical protein
MFCFTPSISGSVFCLFLKRLIDDFGSDPDIQLVHNILNNIQNLTTDRSLNKIDRFINDLSIVNVKTEFLMTLILNQIDIYRTYEFEKRILALEKKLL